MQYDEKLPVQYNMQCEDLDRDVDFIVMTDIKNCCPACYHVFIHQRTCLFRSFITCYLKIFYIDTFLLQDIIYSLYLQTRYTTMDNVMHDYEYYEAGAKDVKLEDITSDEYNADILERFRDDDPYFTYFFIVSDHEDDYDFVVREGDHLGWLGYFAGRSDKLRTLYIESIPENINLDAFFEGLGHNRSIEELYIRKDLGESFMSLIPFLRNNDSLRHLNFDAFDIGLQCARNVAMLLRQKSFLKHLTFDSEINFGDEGLAEVATALRSQLQMEELCVYGNSVGRDGYVALGNALEGCLSLRVLELSTFGNNGENTGLIDDEGLHALAEGLKHCHNLTSFDLYGNLMITEEGSRSLSAFFQSDHCRLEHLDLGKMSIDDNGMAVLATGLASLSSLKRLELSHMSIDDQGLQDLARGLVNCNLEKLDLSGNTLMDTLSGLRALGTLVALRTANIHWLNLSNSSITDEGLQSFVEGTENFCSLTRLDLSHNRSITANGLTSLSSLLRAEHCSLRALVLNGVHIDDEGAAVLANGLVGNKSLTALEFSSTDSGITARGWATFRRLLCDTSSMNNTYLSNHALERIGEYRMENTPLDIEGYLKWNKLENQAAAICKILHSYPDIDVTPMFEFNLGCLHLLVAWSEKAKSYRCKVNQPTWRWGILDLIEHRQLSAVYKFIRGMPLLAANGFRSQKVNDVQLQLELNSKKRKLDQR